MRSEFHHYVIYYCRLVNAFCKSKRGFVTWKTDIFRKKPAKGTHSNVEYTAHCRLRHIKSVSYSSSKHARNKNIISRNESFIKIAQNPFLAKYDGPKVLYNHKIRSHGTWKQLINQSLQ